MTRKVVTSLVWQGSANIASQAISWLSTLLVIRLLSPGDYGLIAMGAPSISFLMLIGDLGVGAVVVQAPTLKRPQLKALFGAALLAHLVGAVVAFASAPMIAAFFAEPRLIPIVRALSLCFVFAGFYAVPQALLQRTLEFDRKAKVDALTVVVASVCSLGLALGGWGVWSLVGAVLATHAFRAVAFQIVRPCLFLPFPALAELRGVVHFGGLVTLDRILWFGHTNLDVVIAGRALGSAFVGVYSVALSLATIPLDKVMSVVTQVSFSAFSRAQDYPVGLRRGMLHALESVSLVAFPTFVGMALVAPEAIAVFLGPKWAVAVMPFQILCLALPFRALGLLFAPALFGIGHPRVAVENSAIKLAGVAVALIVGVQWGLVGLCLGTLVGYIPVFCVTTYRGLATLQIPTGKAVWAIGIPLAGALAMSVGVVGARTFVADALPSVVALGGLILLGAGIYGAVMAAVRPEAVRMVWRLGAEK